MVVVSKPGTNFITGGGYLINQASAGKYAGDADAKTNLGINLKVNNKLTNLQGRVNIITRQNGHVYQIKSTTLASLVASLSSGKAELLSKANIQDITEPLNPRRMASQLHILAGERSQNWLGKTRKKIAHKCECLFIFFTLKEVKLLGVIYFMSYTEF